MGKTEIYRKMCRKMYRDRRIDRKNMIEQLYRLMKKNRDDLGACPFDHRGSLVMVFASYC